jgi:hypothetical protein
MPSTDLRTDLRILFENTQVYCSPSPKDTIQLHLLRGIRSLVSAFVSSSSHKQTRKQHLPVKNQEGLPKQFIFFQAAFLKSQRGSTISDPESQKGSWIFDSEEEIVFASISNTNLFFTQDPDEEVTANLGDTKFLTGNNIQTSGIKVTIPNEGFSLRELEFTGTDDNGVVDISGTRLGFTILKESTTLPLNFPEVIYIDAGSNDVRITLPTDNSDLNGRVLTIKRIDRSSHRVSIIGPVDGGGSICIRTKCKKDYSCSSCRLTRAIRLQYVAGQYFSI